MAAKKKRSKPKPIGPKTLTGSEEAMQRSCVILETMSGLVSPAKASEALGVSMNRYYQLETKALQGLIGALEPRRHAPRRTPAQALKHLKEENARLERELLRYRALVRTAQRTIGLAKAAPVKAGSKAARRPRVRARTVLKTLRERPAANVSAKAPSQEGSDAKRTTGTRRRAREGA